MCLITIPGASGKMGKALIAAVAKNTQTHLAAAITRPDSETHLGKDASLLANLSSLGVTIQSDFEAALQLTDIVIDFTSPNGSLHFLQICNEYQVPVVIGTTGFSDLQHREIQDIAKNLPIILSPNMSPGINLLFSLLHKTAAVIGKQADIEIIEAHHRAKVDAPSGTAIHMGKVIAETLNRSLNDCAIYGREGNTGERQRETIGFSTIRAGNITGEHTALFALDNEQIELTHKASNRSVFANGAIMAALWLHAHRNMPGLYSMADVLGL